MNKFVLNTWQLRQNVKNLRNKIGDVQFCAMVKANAYGHGLVQVCKAIQDLVDYFGVAYVGEGIKLRNNNIYTKILVVGGFEKKQIRTAIINDLILSVCSLQELQDISKISKALKIKSRVHIKINTGMKRYGIDNISDFKKMIAFLRREKYLKLDGIFSHISYSENVKTTAKQQIEFEKYFRFCKGVVRHLSASQTALEYPQLRYDMVRFGIAMYGYSSITTPVLIVKSNILFIKQVKKGQTVGYNNTYVAQNNMKIALIPMGYADGENWKLGNVGYVTIGGKHANIVGRICMDRFMVDVTDIQAKIGQEVIVLDKKNNAKEWAKKCGTIEYEILTSFKLRVSEN